ncbi:hypothetical protein IV203_022109 [Nitzschia inconspicua]|uniref:Uncharacterized protein n=1 Tax=Nitzschia inconspicua TaxID=303405 RepID=A0A9K3KIX4_9STRA|nr:hypothetical protein IV203_022109 [Nitzschia inconspicua]
MNNVLVLGFDVPSNAIGLIVMPCQSHCIVRTLLQESYIDPETLTPTLKATTAAPFAASSDEDVCVSLCHIISLPVSMGDGVLIPGWNPEISYRSTKVTISPTAIQEFP